MARIELSVLFACLFLVIMAPIHQGAEPIALRLTSQTETSPGSGRFHRTQTPESWQPQETAIIVCDVWDSHHCHRAVLRVGELAPRLDQLLKNAREQGVTIIHSPSGCMAAYAQHPARARAQSAAAAAKFPPDIDAWCYKIPSEEKGEYPIDQSDGGEDDDPEEHAQWVEKLKAMGRDPKAPWLKQVDAISIDAQRDYITDQGPEVWNILNAKGIQNVILAGVHLNMCVLGRPFGLRQMVKAGKHTVLMRDMTDTMYNPKSKPFVSHFSGTDLIIDHVERFVCPSITSDQFIGGSTFRFAADRRPHVAILMAEDEYLTEKSLPTWAADQLRKDYRVSLVFGNEQKRNDLPGIETIANADVVIVSIRRRPLPEPQLSILRKFVASGKPIIGIRTASHAFAARDGVVAEGLAAWPEFDAQVLGGNYSNHFGNELKPQIQIVQDATKHPILLGIDPTFVFESAGSLYKTSPLVEGAAVLIQGTIPSQPAEPVAWTFTRKDGGRSFYTSLGHVKDFELPQFQKLLRNAVDWTVAK